MATTEAGRLQLKLEVLARRSKDYRNQGELCADIKMSRATLSKIENAVEVSEDKYRDLDKIFPELEPGGALRMANGETLILRPEPHLDELRTAWRGLDEDVQRAVVGLVQALSAALERRQPPR